MRLAAIFSGGKDSTFSIYQAIKAGYKIKYLITLKPRNPESFMFHYPCIDLTKIQARALGIEQIFKEVSGEKEKEVEELESVINEIRKGIDGILTGALASKYQKERIDRIAKDLGLVSIAPLWHINMENYWEELLRKKFKVMIVSVSTQGLGKSWLGRVIDKEAIEELKHLANKFKFHLGFEGGEAETFVLDAPIFRERIEISKFDVIWDSKTASGYIRPIFVKTYKKY